MSEPTFREKCRWYFCDTDRTARAEVTDFDAWSAEIERLYREAHPPKVTAEDVWRGAIQGAGHNPATYLGADDVAPPVRWLCQHIADLRNAAREERSVHGNFPVPRDFDAAGVVVTEVADEDEDEAWIDEAVSNYETQGLAQGWKSAFKRAVRAAYRERHNR